MNSFIFHLLYLLLLRYMYLFVLIHIYFPFFPCF